jgi:hypothetical protein
MICIILTQAKIVGLESLGKVLGKNIRKLKKVGQKLEFLEMPITQIIIYCNLNQAILLYSVVA